MELLSINNIEDKTDIILSILEEVAKGNPLNKVCENYGHTYSSVYWAITSNEEYSKLYARAKELRAHILAEEIIAISDDNSGDVIIHTLTGERIENKEFVNRSRLKVDARKWAVSKMLPKVYGDKIDVEHSGTIEQQVFIIGGVEVKM